MLNENEQQIVNDFLTAVAPRLKANSNVEFNEAEIVLSISAITLLCREKAEKQGTSFQSEFDSAFSEMLKHLGAETRERLKGQIGTLGSTEAGCLRKLATELENTFLATSFTIKYMLEFAFERVLAYVKANWSWTAEKATMTYNYLVAQGSEAYTWLKDTAAPWVGNTLVQAYDWTRNQVISIARFSWSQLQAVSDLIVAAFQSVLNVLGKMLTSIDMKLGQWCMPGVIKQMVMLTKDCKITLSHTVIAAMEGYTYINVVLGTTADLALLRSEIAGCGVFLG
jgi:hypothetical protein